MNIFSHGSRKENKITLTFDDGPSEQTIQILEILKKYNIKATFFIVGKMIRGREEIIERVKQDGHAFGNHTYTHKRLWFKSRKFIEREIVECDREMARVGIETDLFRFPGFRFGLNGLLACWEFKKKVIFGTLFYDWVSYDWFNPWLKRRKDITGEEKVDGVIKRVFSKTRNGSILVFHDYLQEIGPNKEIGQILERIIPKLQTQYQIVPLSEIIKPVELL